MLEGEFGKETRDRLSQTQARRYVLLVHVGQTLPVGHSRPAAHSCTAGELGMVFKI